MGSKRRDDRGAEAYNRDYLRTHGYRAEGLQINWPLMLVLAVVLLGAIAHSVIR